MNGMPYQRKTAMTKVLIAHQSTIPHYRVPFYEAVQQTKPSWWDFEVVFDENPVRRRKLFIEPIEPEKFGFATIPTRTMVFNLPRRRVVFQTFVRRLEGYGLIVLEDSLRNLSYPLARLMRKRDTALAYWGHGRDYSIGRAAGWKKISERAKRGLMRRCDGYFAYTEGVKSDLVSDGVDASRIFVLNNTIDINADRSSFKATIARRSQLREAVGLSGRKVLLFVGRLTPGKRLGYLADAVQILRRKNPEYHLVVIGGGNQSIIAELQERLGVDGLTYCGVIVERSRLAGWYVLSDAYVHPGDVGLGIVQSLCYDLTPVVVDRPTHNPEYEYLDQHNSVVAPVHASPAQYGGEIDRLCSNPALWRRYREKAWPSVRHLTIEAMAGAFVAGVNRILQSG
jgi:glycosyltransferase involved in cell wall biosynthesis